MTTPSARPAGQRTEHRPPLHVAVAVWAAITVVFALHEYFSSNADGHPVSLALAFYWSASEWMTWAAVTPLAVWLVIAHPLDARPPASRFVRYLIAGLALATLQAVIQSAIDVAVVALTDAPGTSVRVWLSGDSGGGVATLGYLLQRKIGFSFAVFWAIVAAAHGPTYYRLLRAREIDAARLRADLATAKLHALRQRLQPHFLFNTLNGIAETIREDPVRAEALVTELGHLLRAAVDADTNPTIPLREELELARGFTALQGLRFGDRLSVEWSLDPAADATPVPPQFLQPAIENAVRFAIGRAEGPARVRVEAIVRESRLHITVTDSGPGPEEPGSHEGTGLTATRARLEAQFGEAFEMSLGRGASGGGVMHFNLPVMR